MRKQVKALIWATSVSAIAATGIFLGVHLYSKTDSAKGTKIHFIENKEVKFDEFQYQLIDGLSGTNDVIWEWNKDMAQDPRDLDGDINAVVSDYKNKHGNADPIFRITKGFFKMNNKYIDAVSIKDWIDFTYWYLGYTQKDGTRVSGHLAYGPEASSISTFEIVPGIDAEAGGAVILGGRDSSNNEYDKITFYPDAFFGTFSMYDSVGSYFDRLVEPMFPNNTYDSSNSAEAKEFTFDEAQKAIELLNKVNTFNKDYVANSKHLDPRVVSYWNDAKWGASSFTFNGSNAPAPYAIVPGSNKDGVQYYKIYSELFSRKDPDKNHLYGQPSLLRAVAAKYPSLMQTIDSPYIQYNEATGEYKLLKGIHKEIPFAKQIGLPYILKTMNPEYLEDGSKNPKAFQGFGTDFLKYVSIHEYGHHLTLIGASDASEGGITVGGWNGRSAPLATALYNFDVLNKYLKARSAGLLAIKTDQYGVPISGWREDASDAEKKAYDEYNTSYWAFAIPAIRKGANGAILPGYTYLIETIDDVTSDQAVSRAFRKTIADLKQAYVEAIAAGDKHLITTLYNAYIQNSFDTTSGTLNPASENGPFQYAEAAEMGLEGKTLINKMTSIWSYLGRQVSKYELKMIINAINSTARRANPAFLKGSDVVTWPETEIRNFISYLNFMYKKPANYAWGFDYSNKNSAANIAVADTMLTKFFHFYTDEEFQKTWIIGGAEVKLFLKTIDEKLSLPITAGSGFDQNISYAVLYGRRTIDTILDSQSIKNPDNAFYNIQTHQWTSFDEAILNWTDGSGEHKLFKAATAGQTPDFTYDSVQEFKDWNAYDEWTLESRKQLTLSLDFANKIEDYKDKDGHRIQIDTDAQGNPIYLPENPTDAQKAKAKEVLIAKIKHLLNTQVLVSWSIGSASPDSAGKVPFKSDLEGIFANYVYSYPEAMTRDFVQSTFWFDQDAKGRGDLLRNTDPMLGVTASDTTFEYYVAADLSKIYATHNDDGELLSENFITEVDAEMWIKPLAEAIRIGDDEIISNVQYKGQPLTFDGFERELIEKMDQSESTSGFLSPEYGIEPANTVFGHDKFLSNGFENDHSQKVVNGQQLYYDNQAMIDNEWNRIADWFRLYEFDDSTLPLADLQAFAQTTGIGVDINVAGGVAKTKDILWNDIKKVKAKELAIWFANQHDKVFGATKWKTPLQNLASAQPGAARWILPIDNKRILGPDKTLATTWAQAYWYFLLSDYGIGDRTISSEWRDSEIDKNIMFGYIPKDIDVSALLFTDIKTGEQVKIKVYTENTNNLFYLQKQGDASDASRVTLEEQGYKSWTTDRNAIGVYLNSKLSSVDNVDFRVDFVDEQGNVVKDHNGNNLLTMGSRNYIAENGKYYRTAPTYFEKTIVNGQEVIIFHVKPQFNV